MSKGNPQLALQDKGVIDSGCSRHMIGNMSYLTDFEELNGGYVAFGSNPKGGKITGKGKIKTGKLDFDNVYFVKELKFNLFSVSQMVPRENNMYNVNLKNIVPSGDLTCFLQRPHLMNLTYGIEGWPINEVPTASFIVLTVGQNSLNNTNTFSAAGLSNTAVSPTYGDASQFPNDPDMPGLEDIIYSDDEDVVGAEANLNNLESSILVSPIPTTRIHKDHPVSQIIGDLSLTTQTRSMTRAVKDPGGLSQIFGNDFHTCMFACFLSQEEPKRVHQALKDPSWIEAMQEELLQFKMQKVWVLVDLPYGKRAIDDIIFGATNKDLCRSFEKLVKDKFQMSSMGELTFFLGLQVKQNKDGIFISQDKYIAKILRKFGLTEGKLASTPIDTEKPFLKDPDVKRNFRYLKGKSYLGLWYPKDSPFDLVAYLDSDYAGSSLDRKSITGGCKFLGCRLISWQCKKQTVVDTSSTEAEYVAAAS
nr:retrotransposon protein, putative, Ty1-copia subclass [Tanacetum cinerariifolium]